MSDQDDYGGEKIARLVRLAILLFLVYAIAVTVPQFVGDKKPDVPPEIIAAVNAPVLPPKKEKDCDCSGTAFTNFSMLAFPLFPISSPSVAVSDLKEGEGKPLACGQIVTLRYAYSSRGGSVIFSNLDKGEPTHKLRVGAGEMLPGFERGIIGMKAGGERDISIPPSLGFGAPIKVESLRDYTQFKFAETAKLLTARAVLLSIENPLPESDLKLRILENNIGGEGSAECGSTVRVMLTLWSLDGKQLYASSGNHLTVTLGKSQLPYGIEQGIIGLMKRGSRTVIIPPAYLRPIDSKAESLLKDVKLPENQIVIAAVEILSDLPPQEAAPEKAAKSDKDTGKPKETTKPKP